MTQYNPYYVVSRRKQQKGECGSTKKKVNNTTTATTNVVDEKKKAICIKRKLMSSLHRRETTTASKKTRLLSLSVSILIVMTAILHLSSIFQHKYGTTSTPSESNTVAVIVGEQLDSSSPSTDARGETLSETTTSHNTQESTQETPPSDTTTTSVLPSTTNKTTQSTIYQPNDVVYMAYYYPWYIPQDFNTRHGPIKEKPKLGYYDTSDTTIIEQHIDWMVDLADIDGLLVSWDERNTLLTQHLDTGFLQAKNLHKLKNGWCIMYESWNSLVPNQGDGGNKVIPNFKDGMILDKLLKDMKLLQEKYFHLDSYWKMNDNGKQRPVVILYLTRAWSNWNRKFMSLLQETLKDDVFFIADEAFVGGRRATPEWSKYGRATDDRKDRGTSYEGAITDMWFEAYTSYNVYEPRLIQEGDTASSYMLREGMHLYQNWAAETYMIPHVLPKYHDFREGNPDLKGTTDGLIEQLKAVTCLPRSTNLAKRMPRYTFITSWNEWFEGTQIEPSVEDDSTTISGFEWMATLKQFKESKYECPPTTQTIVSPEESEDAIKVE